MPKRFEIKWSPLNDSKVKLKMELMKNKNDPLIMLS